MRRLLVISLGVWLGAGMLGWIGGRPERAVAQAFDIQRLVEAARREPELVVLSNSGLITQIARKFAEKYSLKAVGIKANSLAQVQRVTREVTSGAVTVGALIIEDGPAVQELLLRKGYVENWVPPDLAAAIPKEWQNPLIAVWSAKVLTYNPSVYRNCPAPSLWDLAEPQWTGKVAFKDPLEAPEMITWFSWLTTPEYAASLRMSYQRRTGRALEIQEKNAGYEFIRRLAANRPILGRSDDDVSAAIGSPGQREAPVGIVSLAKFAQAAEKGESLAACVNAYPFIGWAYPRHIVTVKKAPAPNAARLFVYFVMTGEGARPFIDFYGEFSANLKVPVSDTEGKFLGPRAFWKRYLVFLDPKGNERAWRMREELTDFWRLNYRR
ncbi:MAG: substrate-binding domain-containing protein [Armatimonadota bacterium]|nr:substrate-binding domain-containing protein [Armatimonadota bacterium]MDR7464308.1 substrate-binding domain-containing protein [Armatimonadota bacterium]MDR7468918.1 substrate-binding domain-containing protein [Armatimonadota bacterium]